MNMHLLSSCLFLAHDECLLLKPIEWDYFVHILSRAFGSVGR